MVPPPPPPTHAPRMSPARLCVRQFCTSAWSRLILRPLKPQNSVQPCPCHHTICDESWPVCAKPPLPAPVITPTLTHANAHTSTHPGLPPLPPSHRVPVPHLGPNPLPIPMPSPVLTSPHLSPPFPCRLPHARRPASRWPLLYRPAPPPLVVMRILHSAPPRHPAPAAPLERIPQTARFAKVCHPGSHQV